MQTNEGQYRFEIRENGKVISSRTIDDPFIHTTITTRFDWKSLLKPWTLREPLVFNIVVSGTDEAHRVVFTGDYTPTPKAPAEIVTAIDSSTRYAENTHEGFYAAGPPPRPSHRGVLTPPRIPTRSKQGLLDRFIDRLLYRTLWRF